MPNDKLNDTHLIAPDMRETRPEPNAGHQPSNTLRPVPPRTPPSGGSGVTKDTPPPTTDKK